MSEYVIPGIEIFRRDVSDAEEARRGCLMIPTNTARHILAALSAPAPSQGARPFGLSPLERERIRTALLEALDRAHQYGLDFAQGYDAATEADTVLATLATPSQGAGIGQVVQELVQELTPDQGETAARAFGLAVRLQAALSDAQALPEPEGWRTMDSAPKDGTTIIAWCVHPHARWAGDDKQWSAPVVTQWINHNGGGWTWNGIAGSFTHWMPAPKPPVTP